MEKSESLKLLQTLRDIGPKTAEVLYSMESKPLSQPAFAAPLCNYELLPQEWRERGAGLYVCPPRKPLGYNVPSTQPKMSFMRA